MDVYDCLIQRKQKKILETIFNIHFELMVNRIGDLVPYKTFETSIINPDLHLLVKFAREKLSLRVYPLPPWQGTDISPCAFHSHAEDNVSDKEKKRRKKNPALLLASQKQKTLSSFPLTQNCYFLKSGVQLHAHAKIYTKPIFSQWPSRGREQNSQFSSVAWPCSDKNFFCTAVVSSGGLFKWPEVKDWTDFSVWISYCWEIGSLRTQCAFTKEDLCSLLNDIVTPWVIWPKDQTFLSGFVLPSTPWSSQNVSFS